MTGNIYTGEILDKYQAIVNPRELIDPRIQLLTKITQNDLNAGVDLMTAYKGLRSLHHFNGAFINPLTWGGGDSLELKQQLLDNGDISNFDDSWCFGRRWIDVKTLFISMRMANKLPFQGGLSRCLAKYGINFQGQAHDALDDAKNTFIFFVKLLQELKR